GGSSSRAMSMTGADCGGVRILVTVSSWDWNRAPRFCPETAGPSTGGSPGPSTAWCVEGASPQPGQRLGLAVLGGGHPAGALQDDQGALVDGDVDHLAVEAHRRRALAHALLEDLHHASRVFGLVGIRREDAIQHRHLVGMNTARAFAAELARPLGRALERG